MINLNQKTYNEINLELARRLAIIRKRRKISQSSLAKKSGVTLSSLRRFEQSGDISLQSLTKIAIALDVEEEICGLFTKVPFTSIEEIIDGQGK